MDDVTIEDELEFEQEVSSQPSSETTLFQWSNIFTILNQQWMIFVILSIVVITFLYINSKGRREKRNTTSSNEINGRNASHDSINQYEQMERVRQRQQQAYQEQALLEAERKKAKAVESLNSSNNEKSNRLKYRSNDYNPLTGQSTHGSGDSCSWRPSNRRKPTGG